VTAHFKTFKYTPGYPDRFQRFEEAQDYCRAFFPDYNQNHHHSGLAMYTPSEVHNGRVDEIHAIRQRVLDQAYARHPERFVSGPPVAKRPPECVYINRPKEEDDSSDSSKNRSLKS